MHNPMTKGLYADKLPPAKPTLAQLAGEALEAEAKVFQAISRGGEYAAEDDAAMNTQARFWSALELETGLTRKIMEKML